MSQTVDPIAEAIAKAQAAAADAVRAQMAAQAAAATAPIATQTAANAVATYSAPPPPTPAVMPQRGAPLSMQDMIGGIVVDEWIGVSEDGFKIGKDKALFIGEIIVEIDLANVALSYCIKFGNPAIYYKTYDRFTCASGGSWADAVVKANRVDPTAREYRSADVPMVNIIPLVKGTTMLVDAGKVLGNSLSTTNWNNWQQFAGAVQRAYSGVPLAPNGLPAIVVKAKLSAERRQNKAGNIWGVIKFELVEEQG